MEFFIGSTEENYTPEDWGITVKKENKMKKFFRFIFPPLRVFDDLREQRQQRLIEQQEEIERQREEKLKKDLEKQVEHKVSVLNNTLTFIDKLKNYDKLINHYLLKNIIDYTSFVYDEFSDNTNNLDIHKLEQYNYHYTENLIEFLDKINTNIQENKVNIENKIKLKQISIKNIESILTSIPEKRQTAINIYIEKIKLLFNALYNIQVCKYQDFRIIKPENHNDLTYYVSKYDFKIIDSIDFKETNSDTWQISNNLLTKLYDNYFKFELVDGYIDSSNNQYELFKIRDTDTYFVFIVKCNKFIQVKGKELDKLLNESKTELDILTEEKHQLKRDIKKLENNTIDMYKGIVTQDVSNILQQYYEKIQEFDIKDTSNINIDLAKTNLQLMINTETI